MAMIPADWNSAFGNHLWQSTIVAVMAWLLTAAMRKNGAHMRYRIWLIASVKFLIPFSLFIAIGSQMRWTSAAPIAQSRLSAVVGQVTQPLAEVQSLGGFAAAPVPNQSNVLPALLLSIWACGFLAVTFSWWRRWRQIRAMVRAATPLALEAEKPVLSSPALLEPGVFGVIRPVLLLPRDITVRFSAEHLEPIVAHELCHVRRRDNLAAAIHMTIEAIFWFHPVVWYIGSRLVEERERACDEEVLCLGNKPVIYAESILKTCQLYLELPRTCVSGITGSNLKKRIARIMTQSLTEKLSLSRKLLLAGVAIAIIAGPLLSGLASQTSDQSASANGPLSFEVASVKPNHSGTQFIQIGDTPGGFRATNVTSRMLIQFAYNVKSSELSGGPSWIDSERYDIDARVGESPENANNLTAGFDPHLRQMVQSLLAERFKLVLSHQAKDLPIYVLVVAKNGPKFHETAFQAPDPAVAPNPSGPPKPGQPFRDRGILMRPGQLSMNAVPMSAFANALSGQLGRNVVDKTGLQGKYDLTVQWLPGEGQGQMFEGSGGGPGGSPPLDSAPPPDASGPSIFTALQEQLGLKLESAKGPVQTLVIQSIERPSEN